MIQKVFLLGRPGSGKSTVARLIEISARQRGWITQHIYDYNRLYGMFQQEIENGVPLEKRAFRPKNLEACQGFDVLDFSVLDTVLEQIANEVHTEELLHPNGHKLFLIEFARKEYSRALHIFGDDFLRDAYVLYVRTGLKPCIERVHQRALEKKSKFDHFVSDEIMGSYYSGDDWLSGQLSEYLEYLLGDFINLHFEEIENAGTIQELGDKIEKIVNLLVPELIAV